MNEMFVEMAAQIAAWHEKTFPDATEESQLLKLDEEFAEYADGEFIEELADVTSSPRRCPNAGGICSERSR